MSKIPDVILFKKNGLFYNMVIAFNTSISGLEALCDPKNPMNYYKGQPGICLEGQEHRQFEYDTYDLHKKFISKKLSYPEIISCFCVMLINTTYESVKNINDQSPIFEFFRHIRNACSHNNNFFFIENEPKRKSEWRGKIIDHTKKGRNNPLFGTQCFFDFLESADPIFLLWDIEQHLL